MNEQPPGNLACPNTVAILPKPDTAMRSSTKITASTLSNVGKYRQPGEEQSHPFKLKNQRQGRKNYTISMKM
jgi:hypothetical protein